jgi:peptidoglycan hydrolase-like protein with peptidoglycan-binding domain
MYKIKPFAGFYFCVVSSIINRHMKSFGKKLFLSIFVLTLFISNAGQVWAVTISSLELVSKSTAGVIGNLGSQTVFGKANGRYVVFFSDATNLVSDDTNGVADVFLRDTQSNTTNRISVSTAGVEADDSAYAPSVSEDGRYVVFISAATNLVAGDTNGVTDVFLRDTQSNTTTRISVSTAGVQSNGGVNSYVSMNSDGRYIVFSSAATNLVAGDTNGVTDVFLRDTQSNTTTRISVSTAGLEGDQQSTYNSVSEDGRYVVFISAATNLVSDDTNGVTDVFLRDTQSNTTTRISVSTAGVEGDQQSDNGHPDISTDGRYVIFKSEATNLVAGDTNGVTDVFLRDTQSNTTTRISVSTAGVEADDEIETLNMNSDGRYIVFSSAATNLVSGDTNGAGDIFLRDTQSNTTTRISVSTLGVEADSDSGASLVSNDGSYIIYYSAASNLVSGDTNGVEDVFLVGITYTTTPTTTTQSASSITTTTATLNGNITDTGGEANTERGFDIGTDNTYTMSDVADPTGSYSTGAYTGSATGLSCGTTYHYRAYSTNTAGTGTGSDQEFTTSACPSSSSSSGSSASSRAQNLINMGKVQEAQTIINQFPTQTQNVNLNTNNTNPTTPKPTNTPTVRKGNRNNTVKYIQEYLKIKADGIFGPITQSAVIEFQKLNNLVPDGVVGPRTWGEVK